MFQSVDSSAGAVVLESKLKHGMETELETELEETELEVVALVL